MEYNNPSCELTEEIYEIIRYDSMNIVITEYGFRNSDIQKLGEYTSCPLCYKEIEEVRPNKKITEWLRRLPRYTYSGLRQHIVRSHQLSNEEAVKIRDETIPKSCKSRLPPKLNPPMYRVNIVRCVNSVCNPRKNIPIRLPWIIDVIVEGNDALERIKTCKNMTAVFKVIDTDKNNLYRTLENFESTIQDSIKKYIFKIETDIEGFNISERETPHALAVG